jgi:hypothetical protein
MMPINQEISDIQAIQKIIESSFFHVPVYMSYQNKHYQVKPIKMSPEGLIIRSIGRTDKGPRQLFITNSGNLFLFNFDYRGSKGDLEVLFPVNLHIEKAQRTAERIVLDSKFFISNLVNQHEIARSISFDSLKINQVLANYANKVKGKIATLELYVNDRMDQRLRLLTDYEKPIFIPNRQIPESVTEDFVPFKEYFSLMKTTKNIDKYVSEICVPLKYKNLIPFGYLVAWNTTPLDQNGLKLVEAIADSMVKDIMNLNLIGEWRDKSYVADISEEGFSFLQGNSKNFSKILSLGAVVVFDLFFEESRSYPFRAIVRNILPTETAFRVGCQFFLHEDKETHNLKEILNKLHNT